MRMAALAGAGLAAVLFLLQAGTGSALYGWLAFLLAAMAAILLGVIMLGQRRREQVERLAREEQQALIERLNRQVSEHSQLEGQLTRAKQDAEAAVLAKGEFFATMSHEIRTPLNGIIPMLDMLLDSDLQGTEQELVRTAFSSSQQLLRIVDDILDYSKLEANHLDLETTAFNLRELMETVIRPLQRPAEAKGLQLMLEIDPAVRLSLRGDPVRLRQVLSNLVGNAVKFTERGSIRVIVRRLGETAQHHQLRFEVRDTGIGISADKRGRLFRPFQQADTSTTRLYGGTGLGLAICKRIVELMDGRIGVESEPDRGSQFWFEIPMLKAQGDLPAQRDPVAGNRLLLLCAPSPMRTRLNALLAQWGHRVTLVESTQEALSQLRAVSSGGNPYRFVVVDASSAGSMLPLLQRNLTRLLGSDARLVVLADEGLSLQLQPGARVVGYHSLDTSLRDTLSNPDLAATDVATSASLPESGTPRPSASPVQPAAAVQTVRPPRVLVVEDNPVNLMVAQRLLTAIGLSSDSAPDGQAALNRMASGRYDIVFMDCQMPVLDGYTATRRWREREATGNQARLTIVAMTANAMAGDREKCLGAGMDDYLSKPVKRQNLEQCLQRWTGWKPGSQPPAAPPPPQQLQAAAAAAPAPLEHGIDVAAPVAAMAEPAVLPIDEHRLPANSPIPAATSTTVPDPASTTGSTIADDESYLSAPAILSGIDLVPDAGVGETWFDTAPAPAALPDPSPISPPPAPPSMAQPPATTAPIATPSIAVPQPPAVAIHASAAMPPDRTPAAAMPPEPRPPASPSVQASSPPNPPLPNPTAPAVAISPPVPAAPAPTPAHRAPAPAPSADQPMTSASPPADSAGSTAIPSVIESAVANTPPLDTGTLDELHDLLGNELNQLIAVYLEDAPKLMARLQAASVGPDWDELRNAAHTLKSSSANLGATTLSAVALSIEKGARERSLNKPAVAVAILSQELARVRTALLQRLPRS